MGALLSLLPRERLLAELVVFKLLELRGLGPDVPLRELLEDVGEPWRSALEEQADKLRNLCPGGR